MTRALNRSLPFWILLVASIALVAAGLLTVLDHLGTMTATLKDGSATGLEVYAGQSWIVIGATLLGAGLLGVLLALALAAASALLGAATARRHETAPQGIDEPAEDDLDPEGARDAHATAEQIAATAGSSDPSEGDETAPIDGQNGSSGSIATATKINVK